MHANDEVEKDRVLAIVRLTSGEVVYGYIHVVPNSRSSDALNDSRGFLPIEHIDGDVIIHSKQMIAQVQEIANVSRCMCDNDPYRVLGVRNWDDEEAIRQSHRRLILRCHPDRYQHLNPPVMFLDRLDELSRSFNAALDKIRARSARGLAA